MHGCYSAQPLKGDATPQASDAFGAERTWGEGWGYYDADQGCQHAFALDERCQQNSIASSHCAEDAACVAGRGAPPRADACSFVLAAMAPPWSPGYAPPCCVDYDTLWRSAGDGAPSVAGDPLIQLQEHIASLLGAEQGSSQVATVA